MTPTSSPTPKYVFRFRIDDPDPEVILFGCVAADLEEAETITRDAGFREFSLFDSWQLHPSETESAARGRISENPLLGPMWLPVVDVITLATSRLEAGRFWRMNVYAGEYGYDPYQSPFAQAMYEADGSIHIEIGGVPTSDLQPMRSRLLEMLGWIDNTSDDAADEDALRQLPLPHRIFEPGWNAATVAEAVLQTLVLGYGIVETDFFDLGDEALTSMEAFDGLDVVDGGPLFRLAPPVEDDSSLDSDEQPEASPPDGDARDRWNSIPPGTPLSDILFAERRGPVPFSHRFGEIEVQHLVAQDRMKLGPTELVVIELDVAAQAFRERGRQAAADLRPTPGWTLCAETRHRLQELPDFAIRSRVQPLGAAHHYDDYYDTSGPDPILPGEVGDYLGLAFDQEAVMRSEDGTAFTVTRAATGEVQLHGLGSHIAGLGFRGGEVWLRFYRDRRIQWQAVGFWDQMGVDVEVAGREPAEPPTIGSVFPWLRADMAKRYGIVLSAVVVDLTPLPELTNLFVSEMPDVEFGELFDSPHLLARSDLCLGPRVLEILDERELDLGPLLTCSVNDLKSLAIPDDVAEGVAWGFIMFTLSMATTESDDSEAHAE